MPTVYDTAEYVPGCAHDDVCNHGRSLQWACQSCGRKLPDGMGVCSCGEPEHHPCHHPSDWFDWHTFREAIVAAEGRRLMPMEDVLRRWRALDRDAVMVWLESMREGCHADLAEADEYPEEAAVLKSDARNRLAGADLLQTMYEEAE